MEYIKYLLISCLLATAFVSCYSKKYLKKVTRNIEDFSEIIVYLDQNGLLNQHDTISIDGSSPLILKFNCWGSEKFNSVLIKRFFSNYKIQSICYRKESDNFFDSVVRFRKDYNPFFGKSITVIYDYGNSNLRKQILNDTSPEGIEYKIINDSFIYRLNRKPAFGE